MRIPEQLNELVRDNRVVPFIGAGFSGVAGFPGWPDLLRQVCGGLAPEVDYDFVARSCKADPLRIAEYLLVKSGGNIGPIRHRLSAVLRTPDRFISSAHIDLINLHTPAIYTTNFDELIEETFRMLDVPVETICNARDLALIRNPVSQLIKFHGDLRYDDTLVLTESSFHSRLDFESPLDLKFRGDILGRSLLFIGYGFGDINVRAIWYKLARLMKDVPIDDRPPSFIVRLSPNPVLEALDHAVGLTTITLNTQAHGSISLEGQQLLERFMMELTFASDEVARPTMSPLPVFASPALIDRAVELVISNPRTLDAGGERLMKAVASRQLHKNTKPSMDRLLKAFAEGPRRGALADYRKSIALNYAINYRSHLTSSVRSHGSD